MDSPSLPGQLPWRLEEETFWELHRRLGECYQNDTRAQCAASPLRHKPRPQSQPLERLNPMNLQFDSPCSGLYDRRYPETSPAILPVEEALRRMVSGGSDGGATAVLPMPATGSRNLHPRSMSGLMAESSLGEAFGEDSARPTQSFEGYWIRTCWVQRSRSHIPRRRSFSAGAGTTGSSQKKSTPWVLNPTGHFRNVWDFFGILFLLMDAVLIPLQLSQVNLHEMLPPIQVVSQFALLYWCVDIPISFLTGYLHKGSLVQDYRRVTCHYVFTWFIPDFAVTITDLFIWYSRESAADGATTTRILRFLRLFRLIRLGKLTRVSTFLRDYFESQVASIQFSLLLVMLGMLLLEHFVACFWYGLGTYDPEAHSWLTASRIREESFFKQYTASLRWAFAQLGVGGTQIEAVTELEGVYTIGVGVISLISSSTVISSMTSLVSALHRRRMEETHQFALLRRFLRQNAISPSLSQRITRFLSYSYYQSQAASQEQPHILDLLSKSLRAELQFSLYRFCLCKQAFLGGILDGDYSLQDGHVMQKIAMHGVAILDAGEDDLVFCSGSSADSCYLLCHGSTRYLHKGTSPEEVQPNLWIAEMCLWTEWMHPGDLLSTSMSKITALHVNAFCEGISSSADLQRQGRVYAMEYVEAMNGQGDLTDLWQFRVSANIVSTAHPAENASASFVKRLFARASQAMAKARVWPSS